MICAGWKLNPAWIAAGTASWNFNGAGLLPHQPTAAKVIIKSLAINGGALDASDMGTGKTFTAGAVIRNLDLPTLVVCPAIAVTSWTRMGALLNVAFDAQSWELIRTGNTPFGTWENPKPKRAERILECTCCQREVNLQNIRCEARHDGIHCIEVKTKSHKYGKFKWNPGVKFLVFDEVHRACGLDSLHSEMLLAAGRQKILCLGLSATVATTPLNFKALGYVLGLHGYCDTPALPGFYRWAAGFGCRRDGLRGFVFAGSEHSKRSRMARLHHDLFPIRGVRVKIEDLDSFPASQITAELYDLDKNRQIDSLYKEMACALAELRKKVGGEISLYPLTRILRARQEIELLKIPIFEELAREAFEAGHSVAMFLNFTQTIDELARRFKTDCIVDGRNTGVTRQKQVDRFQANESRLIILNGQAGGVCLSLHDEHGGHPRMGIVSLNYSAVIVRQIFGRLPRAGGKSKCLYRLPLVAGTVEERVHYLVTPKLNYLDALNDSDLLAENLPLIPTEFDPLTLTEFQSTLNEHVSESC